MTRCSQAACPNTNLKPYKLALRNQYTILCSSCADSMIRLGLGLTAVERRSVDLPVLSERRRSFRPRWMTRLTARDETRAVA